MVTVIATGFSSAEDNMSVMQEEEQQDYPQYNTYAQQTSDDYDQIPAIQSTRDKFLNRRR